MVQKGLKKQEDPSEVLHARNSCRSIPADTSHIRQHRLDVYGCEIVTFMVLTCSSASMTPFTMSTPLT